MRTLVIVYEKNGFLFKKKEVTVCISLETKQGIVVVEAINNGEIESLIRSKIELSSEDIRTEGIREETMLLEKIKEILIDKKLNGFTVKDKPFYISK